MFPKFPIDDGHFGYITKLRIEKHGLNFKFNFRCGLNPRSFSKMALPPPWVLTSDGFPTKLLVSLENFGNFGNVFFFWPSVSSTNFAIFFGI